MDEDDKEQLKKLVRDTKVVYDLEELDVRYLLLLVNRLEERLKALEILNADRR